MHACDKHSGGEVRTVLSGGGLQPLDLHVFTRQRQPLPVPASPCTRANGGCSHLCLLASNRAGYVCSCPTGIVLQNRTHCRQREYGASGADAALSRLGARPRGTWMLFRLAQLAMFIKLITIRCDGRERDSPSSRPICP